MDAAVQEAIYAAMREFDCSYAEAVHLLRTWLARLDFDAWEYPTTGRVLQ